MTDYTSGCPVHRACCCGSRSPRFYGEHVSQTNAQAFARFNASSWTRLSRSNSCWPTSGLCHVLRFCLLVLHDGVRASCRRRHARTSPTVFGSSSLRRSGYGDEYPGNIQGRLISIMASIAAVVMLAIIVNLVITKVCHRARKQGHRDWTASRCESTKIERVSPFSAGPATRFQAHEAASVQLCPGAYGDPGEMPRRPQNQDCRHRCGPTYPC